MAAHDFEHSYHEEAKKFKIAPAASFYLKTYQVLPSEVKASGPKSMIQKGDVLSFINSQKLVKGQRRASSATK